MIPYILSERNENFVECNSDFVATINNNLVCLSVVDVSVKVKKVFSDLILQKGSISVNDRKDYFFTKEIRSYGNYGDKQKYRYKLSKHDDKNTHGILYNSDLDKFIYDWGGEGLIKLFTQYLKNRHYLPITEDIVEQVFQHASEDSLLGVESIVKACEIYTSKEDMRDVCVWYVESVEMFKELLEKITLTKRKKDGFNWGSINNVSDYLTIFADPIKDKLKENINVLYDKGKIDVKMNEKRKPFEGQLPVIQGSLEALKKRKNRFIYLAGEPGTGKTTMSIKTNHLHHTAKGRASYCTLVIAPTITLTQWREEIKKTILEDIDVKILKSTSEFIRMYENTKMKMDKPTYILIGKETFKLSYKTKHSVRVVKRNIPVEIEKEFWTDVENQTVEVCTCPDCGLPLKNPLRKTTVYFTEKDFRTPKKSNYKCSECKSVLWQAAYEKTKKTSVIDYIKRKNIKFDSSILDEIHESNNFDSILGMATRDVLQRSAKSILLSGTISNGYVSSIYNILFALIPNTLKKDKVFTKEDFIKTYGTLMAVTKNKDNHFHITSRTQVKDSAFQEIEGINPLVFTKYFAESFVFVNLEDIKSDIPNLNEEYIAVEHVDEVVKNEKELSADIKRATPYNASFYNESVIKHYTNKPYDWSTIPFEYGEDSERADEYIQPSNTVIKGLLPKDEKLIEVCLDKVARGEKVWIYNDFVTNGKYTNNESVEDRLKNILEQAGLSVYVLKSTSRTIERKSIIEKSKDKYDVFISNPELVGTGVNMQWCNNYIFYSPTYHVNIVRQAKMRGLRANSVVDSNVFHLYYSDGIEKEIMERYKLKLAESESIQAKFTDITGVKRTASSLGARIEKELAV